MWLKDTLARTFTWEEAIVYCNDLSLIYGDWRLPNVRELQSLVEYGRSSPAINGIFNAVSNAYWTSTTYIPFPGYAWYVEFTNGAVSYTPKSGSYYLLPVRDVNPVRGSLPSTGMTWCYSDVGFPTDCDETSFADKDGTPFGLVGSYTIPGQDGFFQKGCPAEGRFIDHGDGTVTDTCTELMWQQNPTDTNLDGTPDAQDYIPWTGAPTQTQGALEYCEELVLGGHTDWRLPNVRELMSLVNYGEAYPPINKKYFATIMGSYWTSTTEISSPGNAWYVSFYYENGSYSGIVSSYPKANGLYVRAVRTVR